MGSEQSNMQRQGSLGKNSSKQLNIRRQHTIAAPGRNDLPENNESARPGSISPGPSVCSDVDLPYISYTVNRPIGDSPKLTNKQLVKSKSVNTRRTSQPKPIKSKTGNTHNIVVVRGATTTTSTTEKDPDVLRLQNIPMFLPIMRATLNLPAARDPEVLERLDPLPFRNICLKYQQHLNSTALLVANEQNILTNRVKEVDAEISKMVILATEKQKKFAKYAEKFSKIHELSHQLSRCHMLLNETIESMETLNNHLDVNERLEPFVWTTG